MKSTRPSTLFAKSLFLIFILQFTVGSIAYAQVSTPDYTNTSSGTSIDPKDLLLSEKIPGLEEQVDVKITPENPKPGQEVTIEVRIFGSDTNTNLIVWKTNGKESQKGVGQNKFTFTVGNSGTNTTIDVSIFPKSGNPITKSFSFSPMDVDILWQAKTYTPPFYRGKALFTPEAEVEFISLPNAFVGGSKINASNMVYQWKMNYELDSNASGFGKNTFGFKGPIIIRDTYISNSVYSAVDKTIQGSNSVKVNYSAPQIILYEDSPTLGTLFNRALRTPYKLSKGEVKFAAIPYFFSTQNKNLTVNYIWKLDKENLNMPGSQNSVVFKRANSEKGRALIDLLVTNPRHILQRNGVSFTIEYDKN